MSSLIVPQWCAISYSYNHDAERMIAAHVEQHVGVKVEDLLNGYRPTHDFTMLGVKCELKTTGSHSLFVETKNKDGSPGGLLISEAQFVFVLSKGERLSPVRMDVGKLRVFKRQTLLDACAVDNYLEHFTSGMHGHRVNVGSLPDMYLGDFPATTVGDMPGYHNSFFAYGPGCAQFKLALLKAAVREMEGD